ncbi:MAG TPA: biotin/lipoate A/B protein ligase family protein [Chloroflexia bacterium]|nr:biotin/lipoate A/B protein ligase family protein [Chloroflexia bacterium]
MNWRLITTPPETGHGNMALDEALLESVIAGGPPVVRFYGWQPGCLSVGTNQPLERQIDTEWVRQQGYTLVRRPTGGRAVLHDGPRELTYSLVAPVDDPRVSGGVVESYRKISTGLVEGLARLGIAARMAEPPEVAALRGGSPLAAARAEIAARRAGRPNPGHLDPAGAVCFDEATDYEITVQGRKVIGSAQTRRGGMLLQQGSVLLDADLDRWSRAFRHGSEAVRLRAQTQLTLRMAGLNDFVPRPLRAEEVIEMLKAGLEAALAVTLQPAELTPDERARMDTLVVTKYATDEWTLRK